MEVNILLGHNFTKTQIKQLNIANSTDLNGWYIYSDNVACINVISGDFKKKTSFSTFLKFFTQIASHEPIHHTIWEITNKTSACNTEEKFVELMTGERKWD